MERNNLCSINVAYLLSTIYCLLSIICGCVEQRHAVIAVTGTNIGLELAENTATQTPHVKLGYQRGEIAIVPSNRSGGIHPGTTTAKDKNQKGEAETTKFVGEGAKDIGDVILEFEFANIFSWRSLSGPSIRQRLAVGKTAVQQPSFFFAGDKGRMLTQLIKDEKAKIVAFYSSNPNAQNDVKLAVTNAGYTNWDTFINGIPNEPSLQTIEKIENELKLKGITVP